MQSEWSLLWLCRDRSRIRDAVLVSVVERANDIGANGPRGDHGVLLAFGIGLFVGRADEPAFNKHVIAFEEVCGNALAEAIPGDHVIFVS